MKAGNRIKTDIKNKEKRRGEKNTQKQKWEHMLRRGMRHAGIFSYTTKGLKQRKKPWEILTQDSLLP